ncbi:hypothetical protein EVAR_20006_1 [Eumeta japonica]|uniref:Uncharacterized protein n=1 Tax=Eumeta variegata TaxID=151549 RepID=A0A4C1V9Y8_EUMVA|nr:hypothetical protein EVAR_20006_1 [Eumeta japonica]
MQLPATRNEMIDSIPWRCVMKPADFGRCAAPAKMTVSIKRRRGAARAARGGAAVALSSITRGRTSDADK